MDLSVKSSTVNGGKMSWLGSRHGVTNARTVTIDATSVKDSAKNGYVPAGTPLVEGEKGKFKPAPTDGSVAPVGFVLTDQKFTSGADVVAPMLDHGRIIVENLPVDFTAPETPGAFIYVKKAEV